MDTQPKAVDTWLSRIKLVLEIIAIPVVVYWAFTRFSAEEAPALEHRARIQGELSWHERSDKDCIAEYRIKFENIGKSSIELTKAELRAWLLDDPVPTEAITYVDPLKMRDRKALVDANLDQYLVERYGPGVTDEVGLMFIVKCAPGHMILFMIEGNSQTGRGDKKDWFDHRWDYVCAEPPVSAAGR